MKNFLLFTITTTVGGGVGWWLGEFVGTMTAFIVSGIGTLLGVWAGWWIDREYFQ